MNKFEEEKERLERYIKINLENTINREVECECFGSFYEEGENANQRCLIPCLKDKNNKKYFNTYKTKRICKFYDRRFRTKCKYNGNPFPREKSDFDEVQEENEYLKREFLEVRIDLEETKRELESLKSDKNSKRQFLYVKANPFAEH
ncbi:MAG: hypothetical protein WC584_05315 [Candidatus Pacearchaeota archaeon]